ncbi:MAG: sulfatase-like hydrolase/transferase [Opitutaceae bacterium]
MTARNILWILTTQWRAQATGYGGDPNARTPQLNRLAARSVNYVQAVTPHPMGPFARATLLTGLRSPANGVRGYFDPLPSGARTIAHDLNGRGYLTAFFGKWHLGQRDHTSPLVGEAHARSVVPLAGRGGFQFWEGFESGFLLNDPWLHGTVLPAPQAFSGYQSDVLVDRFAAWLEPQAKDRPIFAVVSLEAPHPPYAAPAAGIVPRNDDELVLAPNVSRGGAVEARARKELAGYYAHIEATDRAIGRLIATVDESWTVVFTSVHGDMHGAHGLFRKGWPHEESVRVPLLVRRPDTAPCTDESAVSLVDVHGMTVAWASPNSLPPAPVPATHAAISMPSVVALPHQCDRVWRGIRTKSRKLIVNDDGTPWLFFDLERDPWELADLVDDPSRTSELHELLKLI